MATGEHPGSPGQDQLFDHRRTSVLRDIGEAHERLGRARDFCHQVMTSAIDWLYAVATTMFTGQNCGTNAMAMVQRLESLAAGLHLCLKQPPYDPPAALTLVEFRSLTGTLALSSQLAETHEMGPLLTTVFEVLAILEHAANARTALDQSRREEAIELIRRLSTSFAERPHVAELKSKG